MKKYNNGGFPKGGKLFIHVDDGIEDILDTSFSLRAKYAIPIEDFRKSWKVKNILIITDRSQIAEMEFKELKNRLMDKGLLILSDCKTRSLMLQHFEINFWSINEPMCPINFNTVGYSSCKIGFSGHEPIKQQIKKWKMIEDVICHLPPNAEEIQYDDLISAIFAKAKTGTQIEAIMKLMN